MKLKRFSMVLLALAALNLPAVAQKPAAMPANVKKITSVEGITEYQLPNGLRVLLFPDPSKPKITVNITYLVGSRMEGYGETGMTHLLEHMLFKGSTKHPKIPDELTSHGSSPNGTTYYDRTNYFETFNASDENLNWALSLEADRMVNSFVAEKDLKSEYSVVRNEFESGENNPSAILQERVLSTMYLWHNYGKSTIGSKEDIEKVPIKNLQAFYKKYYQPDNAVLLVAGKIDEAKTLGLVVKYFGGIPRPSRVLDATYTVEPVQDGERSVTLNRVGDVQSVAVGYHIVAGPDKDYAAFDVLNDVLTNEPNGRLYQNLVKAELATGVYADDPALKDPTYFYVSANVLKDKSLQKAKDVMFGTLEELATKPVTDKEVERGKSKVLNYFEQTYRNTQYIGLLLSEFISQGDWRLAFIYRDNIKKVTADDVNRIVKNYIVASNRTVGMFIPTTDPVRALLPAQPNVASITKDYKGNEALAQAEAFDASPANIDKRTTKGELPGGAKFALLPKSTRGNAVEGRITLRIGNEKALENKAKIASLTASMLKRGTKSHTMAQINETLDQLSSSVYIGAGGQSVFLSIKSTRANLGQVMDLVYEILREPVFPEEEFKTLKNETLSDLEQNRQEPQSLAFNEFDRVCNPHPKGHINYNMTTDEEVDAVKNTNLNDLKKFYKDFYGSGNATVAFVGDFDAAAINGQLNKIFANWQAPTAFARIPAPYNDVAKQNKEIKTPDKKNAMMVCGMNLKLRDDNPDVPALKLGNFIFGGGFLNSRLATRIRQKEGISYGVGSFVQIGALDESGSFGSYAIYNPDNKVKLETAWNEELARMVKEGFTEDELKQAKAGYLQYRESGRAEDAQLAGTLNNNLYLGRTMAWEQDMDNKAQKLTAAQVNAVMKKYLVPEKITFVKAGDFK